ncbi:MAG: lipoprotein signal peptidase [Arcobacteraceae bacterium]|nr:lipoprotein signal peptidase [Arcobacteraceae bacterium]
MLRKLFIFSSIFIVLFIIDQYIKFIFVEGWVKHWDCISLVLAYNYGVAFSMFEFLQEYLKYIQIVLMLSGLIYLAFNKDVFKIYYLPVALLLAGGVSNIYDRFIHGGVVDYVYWHCGFDFAIFNLADVLIDIAVVWIVILNYQASADEKSKD